MEYLPSLPLENVLRRLDVGDLLTCSLVSIDWRKSVNNDYIWKNICYQQCNKITVDYVRTVKSKVFPIFEHPQSKQKRLEPLCCWRITYMQLNHVKYNWQIANHDTYKVTDLAFNHFDLIIDSDILVSNVNDNQCEVWSIRGAPRKLETITCALKEVRCKCMIHIADGRLVIVQDTILQVYHQSNKTFKLQYRRLFNKPEIDSGSIPGSLKIDDWYKESVKRRPTHLQAFYASNFFIGLAENGSFDEAKFHVWNIVTGSKCKEESVKHICPELKDPVHNVKFCSPKTYTGHILVCVQHCRSSRHVGLGASTYYTVIYIYDLLSSVFKKLLTIKPHVPWIYYEDGLILTISDGQSKLNVYNSFNGERLVSKAYEEIINPDSVQVHGEHLGFTTGGDLVVLSVRDFELVFTTAIVKFSSNLFGFDFVFWDWNLLLIARWDKVNKIEVWSIDQKQILSTLEAKGLMFPCSNATKFFVWNEMVTTIYMLQFW